MKFLANENFPYPSIKVLRDNGLEVYSIGEESSGISDEVVLKRAVLEDLIILTFDRDYGELLFKYRLDPPPAIVYFRNKGKVPSDAATMLLEILQNQDLVIQDMFTVISEDGIRQRKLR
jgi:predicted nuclease of predicted toxin-antitoxin system